MQLVKFMKSTMLSKQIIFISAVLAVTNAVPIQPTNLVEEATKQVEELKAIVNGEISSAHNSLNGLFSAFGRNSATIANNAIITLQQEYASVLAKLQTIKDIAYGYGIDPSSCTSVQEDNLALLPLQYTKRITDCIVGVNDQASKIVEQSTYIIDVASSTVSHLEYQISQCHGNLLCISPILTQIELNKIKIPQNIKTEVQVAESTMNTLKLSTKTCADDNLSDYSTLVYTVLENIEECINRLIG